MRRLCIAACLTAALTMPTVPAQAFYRKDCWAGAPCPRYAPPGYYDDDNDVWSIRSPCIRRRHTTRRRHTMRRSIQVRLSSAASSAE